MPSATSGSRASRHLGRHAGRAGQDRPPQLAPHARQVWAGPSPRQDAGDSLLGDRRVERASLAGDRRDHHDLVARSQDPSQGGAPLLQGQAEQPLAVEMEQVEGEERDGPPRTPGEALAQRLVVGPAARVGHHQLAVEHRGPGRDPHREARELGQHRPDVHAARVDDPDQALAGRGPGLHERERPMPAPGGLEQPVGGVEGLGVGRRPHGLDVARAGERRLEEERELLGHRPSMVARHPR